MKTAILAALLVSVSATAAQANDDAVKADDKGITLEQGALKLNIGVRLHVDTAVFDDPALAQTGLTDIAVRRARIEVSGQIGDLVKFRVDREFAGNSKGWRNVWLAVTPTENTDIRGGNMIPPFSGEDLQSSNTIPFAERSLASSLNPGFGLGGKAGISGKRWSVNAGWFTDGLAADDGRQAERGKGVVARVTVLPVSKGDTRLHLALAGEHRTFKLGETLRFSADPGSTLAPNIMSSGTLANLDKLKSWNVEAGFSFGPVLVQAQALGMTISSSVAAPDLHFNGQTVQASWMVTGEHQDYSRSTGNFSGPELKRKGLALELAVRYSRLDLQDGLFDRGVGSAYTGGINFYVWRNLRLSADFTHTRVDFTGLTPDRTNNVGIARFQIAF